MSFNSELPVKLLISDSIYPEISSDNTLVLWSDFSDSAIDNAISIPEFVEENSEKIRLIFLGWVHDFGERKVNNLSLVDFMELHPGFSYWWLAAIAEKCNFAKHPEINDAIKLIALDLLCKRLQVSEIRIVTSNPILAECLKRYCADMNYVYSHVCTRLVDAENSFMRRFLAKLPPTARGFVWLVNHLWKCWPLKGVGLSEWRSSLANLTFFTYTDNWHSSNNYSSAYWSDLPEYLLGEKISTNWLHIYVSDSLNRTPKHLANNLKKFNGLWSGGQVHVTLDTFMTLHVVLRTIKEWFFLIKISYFLNKKISTRLENQIDLWPLFADMWQESLRGAAAVKNLLNMNLLHEAMRLAPHQSKGIYLQENQPWEFALIYNWKIFSHGELIGVPHATVRFWDLRYFYDYRAFLSVNVCSLPLPDKVACNGIVTKKAYLEGMYPINQLVEVEAIRYLDLIRFKNGRFPHIKDKLIRLLVLGDYSPVSTKLQLKMLMGIHSQLPKNLEVTFKPHPNCKVDLKEFISLNMNVSSESIGDLLCGGGIVFASVATSAVVDAYYANVPIISLLDGRNMNFSALRGFKEVSFIRNPKELIVAINHFSSCWSSDGARADFFTLDKNLPRWKNLILGK